MWSSLARTARSRLATTPNLFTPSCARAFPVQTTRTTIGAQWTKSWNGQRAYSALSSTRRASPSALVSKNTFFTRNATQAAASPLGTVAEAKAATNATAVEALPTLAPKAVGFWLLGCSALVIGVIVVGGVTRLTESGLSITEWKPITGIVPPLTRAQWEEEFDKYKQTPEFKMLNHRFTLDEFKNIFYMEWGHRVLGRVIGLAFVMPLGYFAYRGVLPRRLSWQLAGMAGLLGFQGALGWYMVKSGLEDAILTTPGAVPRVSQYRLAAHLGAAFLLYSGMFYTGLAVIKDAAYAQGKPWFSTAEQRLLPAFKRFRGVSKALTALVFVTALSGAFVAGLDAGLVYNEFPYMGETIIPPKGELFNPDYAKSDSDLWWRNILENPTTVQFDHRVLAVTTYTAAGLVWAAAAFSPLKAALPAATKRMAASVFGMANIQLTLGISTLLYLVPTPLAAMHQAGAVALLTTALHLALTLRRPSAAAKAWRAARAAATPKA